MRDVTVTIDRREGTTPSDVKPLIEEVINALSPLRDRIRIRVTRATATLVEDKPWRD